jgi:diguanylate cyclase (GGDEF)-like protein
MKKFLYLDNSTVPEAPNILNLSGYVAPIQDRDTCYEALNRFFLERNLFALPVIDAEMHPVGLIERHTFVEFFGQPFTKEIHGKKSVGLMYSPIVNLKPIVVDASATVDDVAQIIIDAGMGHMVSGFIITSEGKYVGVANGHGLLDEITQRRQTELYALAHYDQLTGLPNRRLFLDRIDQVCRDAKRSGLKAAVMFIDVDRFKQINDNLGHASGDHLLRGVADRLHECARDCDTVARLGGDEFGIVMEGINSSSDSQHIAGRIIDSMAQPFTVMDQELFITVSIGIALYPDDDSAIAGLLTKADAAMYEVKSNGRNGFKYFVPGFEPASLDSMSLEMDLRNAVANNQFVLHYQPQIEMTSGRVIGVEALVRWLHPTRGLLSPAHFIPIAEQTRLIVDIGYWVLAEACAQQLRWVSEGLGQMVISVNVSTLQFQQPDFCQRIESIIGGAGIDPAHIEFELTESIMMHNGHKALETLNKLKESGVSLALDDFGTGFSSLSYLRQFPIDRLKIDQSFIREIEKSGSSESIVRAISILGKSLSMEVVAEGVETNEEFDILKSCNCDGVQGYLFSKPVAAKEFTDALRQNSRVFSGNIEDNRNALPLFS